MIAPLWPHQEEAIEFAISRPNGGAMFAMEVGTGKTRTAIEWAKRKGYDRLFVATPKTGVNVWPKEMAKYYDDGPPAVILKGTNKEQALQLLNTQGPATFITTHAASGGPYLKKLFMDHWSKLKLDATVVDESHFIKSAGSQIAKNWGFYGRRSPERLAMSGTMMHDKPIDVYGQMRYVDPSVFGTNFDAFTGRYVHYGGFENRQILGYFNQDDFMRRLGAVTYYAYADEVLDLPEGIDIVRDVKMPASAQRVYDELLKESVAMLTDERYVKADNILTKYMRLQQITSGYVSDDEGDLNMLHTEKQDLFSDILEETEGQKVVVFCLFHRDLDFVRSVTERAGRRYGELSGRRDDLVAASYPPDTDVLGVQIRAGAAAVDLTASNVAIFYSLDYSLGNYRQARGRVLRPGQNNPVRFIHLLAGNTVDSRVYRLLTLKRDVIEGLRQIYTNRGDFSTPAVWD